jgi:hypothetical protein
MLISYAWCRVVDNIAALPAVGAGGFDCLSGSTGAGVQEPDGPVRRRPVSVLTGVISENSGMAAG